MKGANTTLNPYLTFSGNCEEAMTFYKNALNGNLEMMTFDGSPEPVPAGYEKKIMHATLTFGDAILMASDSMPGREPNTGNNVAMSIACPDLEEGGKIFTNLSQGGHVIMPFADTFWGARFGMLVDKYGISWMMNVELPKE